ncbi:general secretion pathway protein GspK [Salinicola halophilus]|uniref:general secretion pathway protein GspK n=1 Tax=Salinicola halophilus TaxID=184065 RepID=UPI000DA1D65B|nr:type II secretion system protein GspK [Salinicola halophilus]
MRCQDGVAKRQRGAALLLVLWIIALASLLLGNLAVSVQLQQRQAAWQHRHTQASLAAEAGVNLAVASLWRDDGQAWRADGAIHRARVADSELRIRIRSERGKLDLNAADEADLRALLQACGGPADRAASALLARRDGLPLRMLDEVRALPGISEARYRCLLPDITVWSGYSRPDPAFASPRLARVLRLPRSDAALRDPGQIVSVSVEATLSDGFHDRLDVTLVTQAGGAGQKPFRVLRWQQ